ncbi:hypothetical protein PRIPAC_85245 [Pristionchus pacificus]|uniref:Uncharacterized protein n=1 Tax=Pristionchus pacificus TaxID=54126 RepID=A0A2A6BSA4_PRIPA|nr:hypothetical protein PRIPAC_85245 [Pristionchus pacificus]|eukprot:PDM68780.1 hypothetical protein PRIPAC_47082 [Pristionchus pacificus]
METLRIDSRLDSTDESPKSATRNYSLAIPVNRAKRRNHSQSEEEDEECDENQPALSGEKSFHRRRIEIPKNGSMKQGCSMAAPIDLVKEEKSLEEALELDVCTNATPIQSSQLT